MMRARVANRFIKQVEQYNNARTEIESLFNGLPHAPVRLVNVLLTKASAETGIVENTTYFDLASLLTVDAAPGRKDSGTPQKQTIRSYLRTIENQCGDHFQVISDGQKLKIKFPTLPGIYAAHLKSTEEYTDSTTTSYTSKVLINTDENDVIDEPENIDQYTQPYTEEYTPAINACEHTRLNIKTLTNKTNKQTSTVIFSETRQPINPNFYPSAETIATALSRGHSTVTDEDQIKNFILFNQSISSRWASFEPLYLRWLECDNGSKKTKKQQRSDYNGRSSNTNRTVKQTMEDVYRYNSDAIAPGSTRTTAGVCIEGEYIVAVDTDESNLRANIYQQIRCP